jgi:hypothetical protein
MLVLKQWILVTWFVCNIDWIGVIHCLKVWSSICFLCFFLAFSISISLSLSLSLSLSRVEEEIVYSLNSLLVLLLFFGLHFVMDCLGVWSYWFIIPSMDWRLFRVFRDALHFSFAFVFFELEIVHWGGARDSLSLSLFLCVCVFVFDLNCQKVMNVGIFQVSEEFMDGQWAVSTNYCLIRK